MKTTNFLTALALVISLMSCTEEEIKPSIAKQEETKTRVKITIDAIRDVCMESSWSATILVDENDKVDVTKLFDCTHIETTVEVDSKDELIVRMFSSEHFNNAIYYNITIQQEGFEPLTFQEYSYRGVTYNVK